MENVECIEEKKMKTSLMGLSGCGKTSIYNVTLGGFAPEETRKLSPTIMYEVRSHPYLGMEISLWDFGGQQQYTESYLSNPKVLSGTDILVFVIDLHDPDHFEDASKYLEDIVKAFDELNEKPQLHVLLHKYDTEEYPKEHLEKSLEKARSLPILEKTKAIVHSTSIYDQEGLTNIFRKMLVSDFAELRKSIEGAEQHLRELSSRIIVCDIGGNVVVHNVSGFAKGLQLREDLRDFISSCNIVRENFFMSETASFHGESEDGKEIALHVFNYILAVLVMGSPKISDPEEKINALLNDMKVFAQIAAEAGEE